MPTLLNSKNFQLTQRHRRVRYFVGLCRALLFSCFFVLALGLGFIVLYGSQGFWHTCLRVERHEIQQRADGKIYLNLPELSGHQDKVLRKLVGEDIGKILLHTTSSSLRIPLIEEVDVWYKGITWRPGRMPPRYQLDVLEKVSQRFVRQISWGGGDAATPQRAGFAAACWGSLYVVILALVLAFPLSLATAVTLEEFFPRGRLKDCVDVQLSNLSAVPSILFGLLGLAFFEQILGLPHGSSLLGGFTLALMICPTLIAVMRLALKMVPKALKESALALGASPLQVVWNHSLPAAAPTMVTGTLLSVGRALGESASLLLVGLSGFVGNVPLSLWDPTTVLPLQIFMWCKNAAPGFESKTYGGILVLLIFLLVLNLFAAGVRSTYSKEKNHA